MGYFQVHFRQFRMIFFHKVVVVEELIFLQKHNTIFQRVYKVISKCKNDKPLKN